MKAMFSLKTDRILLRMALFVGFLGLLFGIEMAGWGMVLLSASVILALLTTVLIDSEVRR